MGYYVPPVPPVPYTHPSVLRTEISRQTFTYTTASGTAALNIPAGTMYIVLAVTAGSASPVMCYTSFNRTYSSNDYDDVVTVIASTTRSFAFPVHGCVSYAQIFTSIGTGSGGTKTLVVRYMR